MRVRISITVAPIRPRESRRLRGLKPEYEPYSTEWKLTEDDEEETTAMASSVCQHIRHPAVFTGDDGQDPNKWLKGYERIAKFNKWDDTVCLANAFFYLDGTAKQWFENSEENLKSWAEFQKELQRHFGDAQAQRRLAEEKLKCRAQRKGESTQSYIQSVLGLCKIIDPRMNEENKVAHLMKGVAEDMYQALLLKEISTTDDFIKWCQYIETMHQKRIGRKKFERLPNVVSVATVQEDTDLSDLIRQIVREEVKKAMGVYVEPKSDTLEEMIREEVEQTLAPISPRPVPTRRMKPFRPKQNYAATAPRQEPIYVPRKTDIWRTRDNQPVCFHCGRPGHVARYCRERRQIFKEARDRRLRPDLSYRQYWNDDERGGTVPQERSRSPSPQMGRNRGRSPTRRSRSPSPFRRSSPSPSRRNLEN